MVGGGRRQSQSLGRGGERVALHSQKEQKKRLVEVGRELFVLSFAPGAGHGMKEAWNKESFPPSPLSFVFSTLASLPSNFFFGKTSGPPPLKRGAALSRLERWERRRGVALLEGLTPFSLPPPQLRTKSSPPHLSKSTAQCNGGDPERWHNGILRGSEDERKS